MCAGRAPNVTPLAIGRVACRCACAEMVQLSLVRVPECLDHQLDQRWCPACASACTPARTHLVCDADGCADAATPCTAEWRLPALGSERLTWHLLLHNIICLTFVQRFRLTVQGRPCASHVRCAMGYPISDTTSTDRRPQFTVYSVPLSLSSFPHFYDIFYKRAPRQHLVYKIYRKNGGKSSK